MLSFRNRLPIVLVALLALSACATRSISDSGIEPSPYYRGELSEFALIGNAVEGSGSWESAVETPAIQPGGRVLLIQSGADIPDRDLVAEFERHFQVSVFSGVPSGEHGVRGATVEPVSYSIALRSAASRGGMDTIVCVWGLVEDIAKKTPGKSISWVPIVGTFIPDEDQHMSIRLKVGVVDVSTGSWDVFTPPDFDGSQISSNLTRVEVDQKQVSSLKRQAYRSAVSELLTRYPSR